MKQGKYKNQVTDTVQIDGKEIRILSGSQNTETKTYDINAVVKGESPCDFLVKCLANQNQKVFIHFLDYLPTSDKGKGPLNPSEGGDVLALARIQGKYDAGVALEKKGYKTEDSSEQIPVNPNDEKEEMKNEISRLQKEKEQYRKENEEFRKILKAVRKQIPNIPEDTLGPRGSASNSDGIEGVTTDFDNFKVGEKRRGKRLLGRLEDWTAVFKKSNLEKKEK